MLTGRFPIVKNILPAERAIGVESESGWFIGSLVGLFPINLPAVTHLYQ
jgi:hypothetical protein